MKKFESIILSVFTVLLFIIGYNENIGGSHIWDGIGFLFWGNIIVGGICNMIDETEELFTWVAFILDIVFIIYIGLTLSM